MVQVSQPPHLCPQTIAEGQREPAQLPGPVPVRQDPAGALCWSHRWAL